MSEVKTIKDVGDETWAEFKVLAAQNKVKLGTLLKTLIEEYKRKSTFWKEILEGDKILSHKEARELEKVIHAVRKEYGFRTSPQIYRAPHHQQNSRSPLKIETHL